MLFHAVRCNQVVVIGEAGGGKSRRLPSADGLTEIGCGGAASHTRPLLPHFPHTPPHRLALEAREGSKGRAHFI